MATDAIEAPTTNAVVNGSNVDLGSGEGAGVREGKVNSDGSKTAEIGLVSGDWSLPLIVSPDMFSIF
jgi:hypothetical protein